MDRLTTATIAADNTKLTNAPNAMTPQTKCNDTIATWTVQIVKTDETKTANSKNRMTRNRTKRTPGETMNTQKGTRK